MALIYSMYLIACLKLYVGNVWSAACDDLLVCS